MGVLRLSTVCRDLDDGLGSASPDHRLQAGWAAAQWAIAQTGLSHPAISAARIGGPTAALTALVSQLDDLYFDLQEMCEAGKSSQAEVLAAFGKARAASAVEFAMRGEAAEAVYEATFCCDDISGLRRAVVTALGAAAEP